jgi:hypothetical protein
MRSVVAVVSALVLVVSATPAAGQRRARFGPTITTISLEDLGGGSHSFTALGGTLALLTGDDNEIALGVTRYRDLSPDNCVRELTFFSFDSYFYPIGARGIAPYAVTEVGLGNLKESVPQFGCGLLPNVSTSTQIGIAYGLGLRVTAGRWIAAMVEGRFFQMPNSAIQALEARANVSMTFGSPRQGNFQGGTLGPVVSYLIPISGSLEARAPFVGVRFRRDTKKKSTVGLQIDYAQLKITEGCSTGSCEPLAILFAPGYETSWHASWGRFYGGAGLILAGFPQEGPDRGIAQGLQGGLGADVFNGKSVMTNINARLVFLQRKSKENVFGVQVGVSISSRLNRPTPPAPTAPNPAHNPAQY